MSDDEPTDEPEEIEVSTGPVGDDEAAPLEGPSGPRERIEEEADRAIESFDEGVIDLLSWILDTNTRAQIYVFLRKHPWSTSEEVAEGTGLYPSTVREALAELHEEDTVSRRKRETEGAGNNPYEYTAIAPSELVGGVVGQIQDELNTVFNLDRYLGGPDETGPETEPVSINVEEADDDVVDVEEIVDESDADGHGGDESDADTDESDADGDESDADGGDSDADDEE